MNYYLLKHDLRNNKFESKIFKEYESFIREDVSLDFARKLPRPAYHAYRLISRKYHPEKMNNEIAGEFMSALKNIILLDDDNALVAKDILRILEKENYLTHFIGSISIIVRNKNINKTIKNVIRDTIITIANYYLLIGKHMDAYRLYQLFNDEFAYLNSLILSIRFFREITISDQGNCNMDKLISIYNDMNSELDRNDISERLVELSDQYVNIYKTISEYEILKNYLCLSVLNYSISNISLLSNIYFASKENNRNKLLANVELIEYLFGNSTNDKIKTIYQLINNKNSFKRSIREIYQYVDTIDIIEGIKEKLKIKQIPNNYAYYTRIENLIYMFPEYLLKKKSDKPIDNIGKLSFMHYAYMNDPKEGMPLLEYITQKRNNSKDKKVTSVDEEIQYPYVFMKCFTPRVDDIPMWEMYGDSAKGCCVILDWKKIIDKTNQDHLFRICYIKQNKVFLSDEKTHKMKLNKDLKASLSSLRKVYRASKNKELFLGLLNEIRYLFKNYEYSHEEEIRFIYFIKEDSNNCRYTDETIPRIYIVPGIKAYINEIILGPRFEDTSLVIPYIQKQLYEMGKYIDNNDKTKIYKSKVNYK